MKGVQCYELFGGIAHKNHAFSFKSILVVLLECRFLVTEVGGLNPGISMLRP